MYFIFSIIMTSLIIVIIKVRANQKRYHGYDKKSTYDTDSGTNNSNWYSGDSGSSGDGGSGGD